MSIGLAAALVLAVAAAGAGPPDAHGAAALRRAQARYLSDTGGHRAALIQLRLHWQDRGALAAWLYASAGLPRQARTALTENSDGPLAAKAMQMAATARLEVADADAAVRAITAVPTPENQAPPGRLASLLARAQLLQGNAFAAKQTLYRKRRDAELTPMDRYQLAIAELRLGAQQKAAGALTALGGYDGDDARLRALADQANLVLGYWLLDMARPASARKAFLRVRMSNPAHAAKAMLGLGWAQFGAVKLPMVLSSVDPRDCDVDEQIWEEDAARAPPRWECRMREYSEDRRLLDFVYLRMGKQTQYERAVIAWREAAAHGKLPDPVVAEALAVLPFALAAAGDQKGAEGAFRSAIAKLGAARLKLAGTPVDPAPRPHSPLARLRQETQAMRARIATLRQRLTQLHQPAAAAQRALDNIGQVLAQLRAAADGPGYAAPSPLQRGRLRLALTTLDPFAGSRTQASERLTFAQAQLQRLSDRLQAAADQIPRLATRNQRQKIAAQRARLDAYLRQARMGLAGVLKIAQD